MKGYGKTMDHFPDVQHEKASNTLFYHQHHEHCVDITRQRLVYTADFGTVTFSWTIGVQNSS